jgi:hypothetical protein
MPDETPHNHNATPAPKALLPLTICLPFGTVNVPISAVRMPHLPAAATLRMVTVLTTAGRPGIPKVTKITNMTGPIMRAALKIAMAPPMMGAGGRAYVE